MRKYKITKWKPAEIAEVEIVRETAQSVFIANSRGADSRESKESSYHRYFDSWDEAHAHLLEKATKMLEWARRDLQVAQSELGNVKGMKRPVTVD